MQIKRKKTYVVKIRNIEVGGNNPVVVQSMTDTPTENVKKTVEQIKRLVKAGSEMVRITVNTEEAAKNVPEIVKMIREQGYDTPIIGDFHFNGHILLRKYPKTAELLDKYRVNPGTKGKERNFEEIIKIAIDNNKPVRIGVNWGSVDKELLTVKMDENSKRRDPKSFKEVLLDTLIESCIISAEKAMDIGLDKNKIILSAKVSEVKELVYVYKTLSKRTSFPLHLGLTEAGMGIKGIVSSAIAIGSLLLEGIGDTIRVSLTPSPDGDRTEEIKIAIQILQSLGIRSFFPEVTSCPGCGRTNSSFFRELALKVEKYLKEKITDKKLKEEARNLKVAVMGCVVNGPGESKYANIGISLPGIGEKKAAIYVDGKFKKVIPIEQAEKEIIKEINEYLRK